MRGIRKNLLVSNTTLFMLFSLIIFTSLSEMAIVYNVYTKITVSYNNIKNEVFDVDSLVWSSIYIFALLLAKAGIMFFTQWAIYQLSFNEYSKLSSKLFTLCLPLIGDGINHLDGNKIYSIINTELEKYCMNYLIASITVFSEFFIMFCLISLLLSQNPPMALTLISVFIVSILSIQFFARPMIIRLGSDRVLAERSRVKWLNSGFDARDDIMINSQVDEFAEKISNASIDLGRAWSLTVALSNLPKTLIEITLFVFVVSYLTMLYTFGWEVSNVVPFLALLGMVTLRILPSVNRLVVSLQHRNYYHGLANEISELFKINVNINTGYQKNNDDGFITASNLRIQFEEHIINTNRMIINKPGLYRINGNSGDGKTTFIKVLLRLYQRFDGIIDQSAGVKISYVSQKPILPVGKLKDGLGVTKENSDYVKNLMCKFNLQHIDLSQELNKNNGELSGGEIQRLAIIRAFAGDARIVLLDEYFSAVDVVNSKRIDDFLVEESAKRVIIFTTHKNPSFRYNDLNLFN